MKRVFVILGACISLVASAQEKEGPNMSNDAKATGDFANIQMAQSLAAYGYASKDALSLLAAAKIVSSISAKDANARGLKATSDKSGSATSGDSVQKTEVRLDAVKLIADAKKIAASDEATLAYINSTAKTIRPQARNAVNGPVIHYDRVYAHTTDSYTIQFYGQETAKVAVKGDGDTDLDLYVYDYNGNLIKYDDDYSDGCYVEWVPKWTGTFTIKIKNRGNVYNNYTLATN